MPNEPSRQRHRGLSPVRAKHMAMVPCAQEAFTKAKPVVGGFPATASSNGLATVFARHAEGGHAEICLRGMGVKNSLGKLKSGKRINNNEGTAC
jgi:hypothetical protein